MALCVLLVLAGLTGCQSVTIHWSDCGNKNTSFRVTSLSPTTFSGESVTLTASGMVTKAIKWGSTFKVETSGFDWGVLFPGNICEKNEIKWPDSSGTKVTFPGFSCPVSAGHAALKIVIDNTLYNPLDINISDSWGDPGCINCAYDLLCLNIRAVKEDSVVGLRAGAIGAEVAHVHPEHAAMIENVKVSAEAAAPLNCKKASYAFCCEVGKPCDCSKGITAPGQCEQASYAFCCSAGTPCDCSAPPFMNIVV